MAEVLTVLCCLLVTQRDSVYDYTKFLFLTTALGYATNMKMCAKKKKMQKRNQTMAEFSPEQHQNGGSCRHCTFLAWFSALAEPEGYPFTHQHIPSAHCNRAGRITHI